MERKGKERYMRWSSREESKKDRHRAKLKEETMEEEANEGLSKQAIRTCQRKASQS